jgi:hypothetical protein
MNPAPERSSPGRIRNPAGKKEKRPKLNRTLLMGDRFNLGSICLALAE